MIVYERFIDDGRRQKPAALLSSLHMLLTSNGGFDFTGAECIDWMQEAGFHNVSIEPLTGDQSMVVGYR